MEREQHTSGESGKRPSVRTMVTEWWVARCRTFFSLPIAKQRLVFVGGCMGIVLVPLFILAFGSPLHFPHDVVVTVPRGSGVVGIASLLQERGVVSSSFWLTMFILAQGGETGVRSGDYFFDQPEGMFTIARRLLKGEYGLKPIKVVIPEGATVKEIGLILEQKIPTFDAVRFAKITKGKEGYLFPDTYFLLPNASTDNIVETLEAIFESRIGTVEGYLRASKHSLHDIIIMASILEREARTTETRRMIAGILWHRIRLGMPLQVDAVFVYINGKGSFDLTLADLRDDSSPYNTYTNRGLPPGPIANPGLDAILAAALPIDSSYLYYLSDMQGNMHYAKTFEQHKANKERYIP